LQFSVRNRKNDHNKFQFDDYKNLAIRHFCEEIAKGDEYTNIAALHPECAGGSAGAHAGLHLQFGPGGHRTVVLLYEYEKIDQKRGGPLSHMRQRASTKEEPKEV
jgi:hypothetical protein